MSDRTGITAEVLSHSLLTQFPDVKFHTRALPFIDTPEKMVHVVREINEAADNDNARPLIFATFVSPQLFEGIRQARGFFRRFIWNVSEAVRDGAAVGVEPPNRP